MHIYSGNQLDLRKGRSRFGPKRRRNRKEGAWQHCGDSPRFNSSQTRRARESNRTGESNDIEIGWEILHLTNISQQQQQQKIYEQSKTCLVHSEEDSVAAQPQTVIMIHAMLISNPTTTLGTTSVRHAASSKRVSSTQPLLFCESRISARMLWQIVNRFSRKQAKKVRKLEVVDELGGQYEYTFNDVKLQIRNYFTIKAVRTVLHQLYEMNPSEYTWFYNYIATNQPGEGKRFLQALAKERQGLAERVMVTRLHLYAKWIKICDHEKIYKEISEENLELMRERLLETVIWPSDDVGSGSDSDSYE